MKGEQVLVPVEQKQVEFYGDELTAVKADDGDVYVSVRHICQVLGLDDNGQRQRIRRHIILTEGLMVCNLHTIQGERETYVLRVDLVPLWLSGIRVISVKEEIQPKLERFQREAAKVLWHAFQEGRLTMETPFDELLATADPEAVQAYQIAEAVLKMARSHIMLQAKLESTQAQVSENSRRLERLEVQFGDETRTISEDQASQISQAVKAIALELSKQKKSNQYGSVYGEMYRKFGVTSYKLLPAHKFKEVMAWLTEWYQSQTDSDIPF